MPELPDVETWKRYVDATSLHRKIGEIEVRAPRMRKGVSVSRLRQALEGEKFTETRRYGKYLFIRAGRKPWLILHFGMTGRLEYSCDVTAPASARMTVHFDNDCRLAGIWQRRLGRISLTDAPENFVREHHLGPDPLESGLDRDAFADLLAGRRGTVKTTLTDQAVLAGLGNVYTDEILFLARIHPRAVAGRLGESDLARLYSAMHHVLATAIDRQADPERLPRTWLLHRRREGDACPRCGGVVERLKQGGRSTYLCPGCQKGGR